jgi:hypothetical protein
LLKLGIDTKIKDIYNFSAYGLAMREENFKVANALLRVGMRDG